MRPVGSDVEQCCGGGGNNTGTATGARAVPRPGRAPARGEGPKRERVRPPPDRSAIKCNNVVQTFPTGPCVSDIEVPAAPQRPRACGCEFARTVAQVPSAANIAATAAAVLRMRVGCHLEPRLRERGETWEREGREMGGRETGERSCGKVSLLFRSGNAPEPPRAMGALTRMGPLSVRGPAPVGTAPSVRGVGPSSAARGSPPAGPEGRRGQAGGVRKAA